MAIVHCMGIFPIFTSLASEYRDTWEETWILEEQGRMGINLEIGFWIVFPLYPQRIQYCCVPDGALSQTDRPNVQILKQI